ncbi:magnesium chelatase domain-containing protein [Sanguibacter sp. Z1732]|uniref:magnesium chelatase domain-containing protein n=1 Tax=Sanguibacter sp. Z1732 TaxID=3435412 RepID=UPI003D9CBC53
MQQDPEHRSRDEQAGGRVMGLGRTWAVALVGMRGVLVEVQSDDAGSGIPEATIVGSVSTAMKEAKHRVKVALKHSGMRWPDKKVVVNLSPADVPKRGSVFDLALATSILCADRQIEAPLAERTVHLGELGLDGRVQPARGVLPAVHAAVRAGYPHVVVPQANAAEAALVHGAQVTGVGHLIDVVRHYGVPIDPDLEEQIRSSAPAQPLKRPCGPLGPRRRSG